jgi:hypothetical protein
MTSDEMKSKIEQQLRSKTCRLLGTTGEPLRAGKDILSAIRQLVDDDLKQAKDGGSSDLVARDMVLDDDVGIAYSFPKCRLTPERHRPSR